MNYKSLEQKIIKAYTEGTNLVDAESLAAEFLEAQIKVSEELKEESIRHRMLKADLKERAASVLYAAATAGDKKPSDSILQALVDKDPGVKEAYQVHIVAEEHANELERLYNIFRESHVYFRGISRGKFE